MDEVETFCYRTDSDTITGYDPDIVQLDRLLVSLESGQERINSRFVRLIGEELSREIQVGERTVPLRFRLHGFYSTTPTTPVKQTF